MDPSLIPQTAAPQGLGQAPIQQPQFGQSAQGTPLGLSAPSFTPGAVPQAPGGVGGQRFFNPGGV